MNLSTRCTGLALATLLIAGCSTVKLKPGAEEIEILKAERVADCRKIGTSTVSVLDELGFIPRGDKAIREDLDRLARNSAVTMKGDTLTRESAIENGEQTFGVYDCI